MGAHLQVRSPKRIIHDGTSDEIFRGFGWINDEAKSIRNNFYGIIIHLRRAVFGKGAVFEFKIGKRGSRPQFGPATLGCCIISGHRLCFRPGLDSLTIRSGHLKEATQLSLGRCFILLGGITLFLISGAAWGQSRPPTAPGPERHLKSDKGDVKSSLEDPREPRLKDWPEQPARIQKNQAGRLRELTPKELREQPVRAQEALGSRPLKYKQVIKANSTVSRFKKPGAEKSPSGAHQDWSGPKA